VPSVKARVRDLDLDRCTALADVALGLDDAAAVRQLVTNVLSAADLARDLGSAATG